MIDLRRVFHTGYVVADLEAAIAACESQLGVAFLPPVERTVARFRDATGERPLSTRMTYSAGEPPFVELIEAAGEGLLSAARIGGMHHIGLWSDDLGADCAALQAQGYVWEAEARDEQGDLAVAFWRSGPLLCELVPHARYQAILAWARGDAGRATTAT